MSPHVPQPFGKDQPEIDQMRRLTRQLDLILLALGVVTGCLVAFTIALAVVASSGAVR